jgi:hypothetical protein
MMSRDPFLATHAVPPRPHVLAPRKIRTPALGGRPGSCTRSSRGSRCSAAIPSPIEPSASRAPPPSHTRRSRAARATAISKNEPCVDRRLMPQRAPIICALSKAHASPRKKLTAATLTAAASLEWSAPTRIATQETLRLGGSACCPCSPCSK